MSGAGGQEPVAPAAVAAGTSGGGTSRLRRWERLEFVGRILITVGAVLAAVGAWMPGEVVNAYALVGGQRQDYVLTLTPGDVEGLYGSFEWSVLTVVPLLVLPLVWWRSRALVWWHSQEVISAIIFFFYSVWSTLVAESSPDALRFSNINDLVLVPEMHPQHLIITHHGDRLMGYWVAFAGGVLIAIGVIFLLFAAFRRPRDPRLQLPVFAGRSTPATPSRPRVALPGASALTIGLGLWAVSTFVMPWASVNCSTTPLFAGTCTGLPYDSVLRLGIADVTTLIDPMVARYAVGMLLGGGAAMILAGLWLRARSVAFCAWATLWLALAAGFAWLAEDGVGVVVEKHDALGLQAGVWTGENAVLLTLLGFILALAGLVYLWVDAVRHRHQHTGVGA